MANGQELGTRVVADTSSSSAAASWIRAKWERWEALALEFPRLMHRAAEVAASSSDAETRAAAKESIQRIGRLWDMHAYVTEKLRGIAGLAPSGLGSVGTIWPAAVIALAVSVAWVITHYDAELRIVGMMEDGRVTPAQARQLLAETEGGALFSAGAIATLPVIAAVGFGLWWIWPRLAGKR